MGLPFEPGFGAPSPPEGTGFGSPPADGIGDLGYGAPYTLDEIIGVDPGGGGTSIDPDASLRLASEAFFDVPLERRRAMEIGEEGGYLLELVAATAIFEDGIDYVVKFRSVDTPAAQYPDTQPGSYSAISGSPYAIRAVRGGRALRFTSPAMPHGFGADALYDVVVTGGLIGELILASAVNVLQRQVSLEVDACRALPPAVYKPWGAVQRLTGYTDTV